jgi:hypothetical protein
VIQEPEIWHEDGCGPAMAISLRGHIPIDDAIAYTWAWLAEYGHDEGGGRIRRGHPRHTWMRKVPWRDEYDCPCMRYDLVGPGRGATPITYVEWSSPWDAITCHRWPACHEPATAAVPIAMSDSAWLPADRSYDGKYTYMCRYHYDEYDQLAKAESLRRYAEWRASQAAA